MDWPNGIMAFRCCCAGLANPQEEKKIVSTSTSIGASYDKKSRGRHGEVSVLREGAHEQGRVDKGGGPAPDRLHQGARRGVLALAAQGRRPPPLRQELQAALDELPPPGPQARQLHRRRRRAHHQAPRPARQQVVADRGAAARPDGQRDQELLEHAHQAQAPQPRHRPADAPPAQRRERRCRGQRAHHVQHRRLPVPAAGAQAGAPGHHHPAQCDVREARAVGGRPQQQRRELGRAALPRPEPRPRPVRRPAVLAAQDAGRRRDDAHLAAAAAAAATGDHLPVLPPRRPRRGGLQLQDRVAGGVPVSQAARGGPVHIGGVVKSQQ
uniref:Uncharacterized protein n=1 Tax=Setaria italica TaxID=4555 RepID=K3XST2_SETIT